MLVFWIQLAISCFYRDPAKLTAVQNNHPAPHEKMKQGLCHCVIASRYEAWTQERRQLSDLGNTLLLLYWVKSLQTCWWRSLEVLLLSAGQRLKQPSGSRNGETQRRKIMPRDQGKKKEKGGKNLRNIEVLYAACKRREKRDSKTQKSVVILVWRLPVKAIPVIYFPYKIFFLVIIL